MLQVSAVQVKHYVTGNDALISWDQPINAGGIADNICGGDSRAWAVRKLRYKVFDMTAATTGINETNAKESGLEVDTSNSFSPTIVMPVTILVEKEVMTMRVVLKRDLSFACGAQIIGYEGLINVLMYCNSNSCVQV